LLSPTPATYVMKAEDLTEEPIDLNKKVMKELEAN
jgi:hypothetical protein